MRLAIASAREVSEKVVHELRKAFLLEPARRQIERLKLVELDARNKARGTKKQERV
jgi:hypothetical protein